MSAMNDMLANMMKQLVPQEVLDLLTKEKLDELGEKINAFIASIHSHFAQIEAKQSAQQVLLETILEAVKNGGHHHIDGGRSDSPGDTDGSIAG